MFSNILSASAIARHIVSVSLLAGAATTMVAGSADSVAAVTHHSEPVAATQPQHGDLEDLVKDCFARYAAAKNSAGDAARASEACRTAIEASGLSPEDFWKKFGKPEPQKPTESKKPEATKKPETPSTNADLEALIKDCIAKYTNAAKSPEGYAAAKEVCMRAIEASGLTPEEFFKKFLQREPEPETTKKPETPSTNADLEALIKDCVAKYTAAYKTDGTGMAAKEACMRAIEASGLTPEEFFKKYLRREPKPETTPETGPTALLKACVTTAAQLTGDSSREDIEKTAAICAKAKTIFDH